MDGFKNTTKTSYDTSSGRKFANGGMTVSRADMPGGEGPMSKPAMVAKYAKGGSVKKGEAKIAKVMGEFASGKLHSGSKKGPEVKNPKQAVAIAMSEARKAGAKMPMKKGLGGGVFNEKGKRATWDEVAAEGRRMEGRKPPVEGISTRPTDASGRRATDAELGMTSPAKKPVGPSSVAVSKVLAGMAKKAMKKNMGGSVSDKPMSGMPDKAAPTMVPKVSVGLSHEQVAAMQKREDAAYKPRIASGEYSVKPMPPKAPSSGNPLMGGMNRGDIVASKPTPVRGPSMAPAHSNRPMIRRAMGGLSVMPKGGKC
jgi:hypothetical protein